MGENIAGPPEPWTSQESPEGASAAATLIILRDSMDGGPPDVLMVQRAATMSFAAGAIVFPGGRVDPADERLAAELPHGFALQDAAARIAAIRETVEEAGIAIGLSPPPSPDIVGAMRIALHAGVGMGTLLELHGLSIDSSVVEPFARWCPGRAERAGISRIFDTRFYVARAPNDAFCATADTTENVRLRWASAATIIEDCDAGREVAIFPTRRNLERLALGNSHEEVVALARTYPPEMVTPWTEVRDGEVHLCIPDYLGYPVTSEVKADIRRG
ncbi:NUDIX domain-containing protein [Sphingobium sufflavum]|uniref:NUDIX domain-containing protein n=1 Tax=Sphingobium sufflavum TaxID=1129547 RepID=UPI001F3CF83A|nr:NUDIX domain-containing protein [Sphingobium sufflavum]MCE7797316.1 NUDIX domain-containing protein [Sphingobium sufflavum]